MQPGFVSVTLCARSKYQNSVPCLEIMKDYNSDMGSIDIIDKKQWPINWVTSLKGAFIFDCFLTSWICVW